MITEMLRGSCLCGAIAYEVRTELGPVVCCHCTMCRKAQGTAFATNAPVPAEGFRFLRGEEVLASYPSSPGKWRCFCPRCGSPILSRRDDKPGVVRLRIGALDTKLAARPAAHIHVASKAEWFDILDGAPQYPGEEPGR